jgi:hypothetical protein
VALPLGFMAFPTVGALIASRVRGNTIGWLLIATGLVQLLGGALGAYSGVDANVPGRVFAGWVVHWSIQSPAIFSLFTFFLLVFPTGRLLGRRWRWLARACVAVTAAYVVLVAFRPGDLAETPFPNPFGVAWLASVWKAVEFPLFLSIMVCLPLAVVSFVIRFRRSRGIERRQMKWFATAGALLASIALSAPLIFKVEALWPVWPWLFMTGTTSIPIAVGIAVLRYRLYDIDRIVSRAVAYAVVSIVLGAVFSAIVLAPTLVVGSRASSPDYLVAIGTLAVAALFRPVRRRVQHVVDRRFNRSRYDAEQTLSRFTRRLREQVDIDALRDELRDVVATTMQPSRISLWIP